MELEERIELHRCFWRGELARPILGFFVTEESWGPPGPACPAIDIDTPAELVVEKCRAAARRQAAGPGERVPDVQVNYGTAFLPALAGGELRHDGHTAWCLPTGQSARELEVPPLRRDLPLWQSYERKLRALVEAGIPDCLVSTGGLTGPMEMLLDLLGPEQLCLDLFDAPEAVSAAAERLTALCLEAFDAQWQVLGREEGNLGFGLYMPGRSALLTEDALALVGPEQFPGFFGPGIRNLAAAMDTPFIHTHSAGLSCYDQMARMDELAGVEISNDPNGPPIEDLVEAGAQFQRAGKSVMF
ncbi:MAG: hypothetical protein R6V05_07575, partial [Candidatus Brocadiia bacterium]